MSGLFITGTAENPGKMLVTAGIAITMQSLGYSTGVYKPICTGVNAVPREFELINRLDPRIKTYSTCEFEEDREPFMAAFAQNRPIQPLELLGDYKKIEPLHEITLIEGTNGPATLIAENFAEETMVRQFQAPILFVVSALDATGAADVINRAISHGIATRGVIVTDFAGPEHKFLAPALEKSTRVPVLGVLGPIPKTVSAEDLIATVINKIDLEAALNMKIAKL